jgi:hypothetical protein
MSRLEKNDGNATWKMQTEKLLTEGNGDWEKRTLRESVAGI